MRQLVQLLIVLLIVSTKNYSQCETSNFGTVVISEIYFDTRYSEDISRKYHTFGEYIELYNSSDQAINLEGWIVSDNHTSYKFQADGQVNNSSNLIIQPGGFKIIAYNGFYAHTNFASSFIGGRAKFLQLFPISESVTLDPNNDIILQNTMVLYNNLDKVRLTTPQGKIVDEVSYNNDNQRVFTNSDPKDFLQIQDYTISISPRIENGDAGVFNGAIGTILFYHPVLQGDGSVIFVPDDEPTQTIYGKASIFRSEVSSYYTGFPIVYSRGLATPMALPDGMDVPARPLDPFFYYQPSNSNSNYAESFSYDIKTGIENGHTKTFFDDLGKPITSLAKDYKNDFVWGTETVYDNFGRKWKESFPTTSCFNFENVNFLSNSFLKANLLDKYYSNNNTLETYQAIAEQPYSEINYDNLNPGNVINIVGGNQINGEWKSGYGFTVPAAQEMYYVFGSNHFNDTREVDYYSNLDNKTLPPYDGLGMTKYGLKITTNPETSIEYPNYIQQIASVGGQYLEVETNFPLQHSTIYKVLYNGNICYAYVMIGHVSPFRGVNYPVANPVKVLAGHWKSFSEIIPNHTISNQIQTVLNNSNNIIAGLKAFKSISIDANGVENVGFFDSDGKSLASARSGGIMQYPVTSLIGNQGFVDIHLPKGCDGTLAYIGGASLYKVYNLRSGAVLSDSEKANMIAGVYRIELINNTSPLGLTYINKITGQIDTVFPNSPGVTYNVNYYDYAINVYDKTGRAIKTIQPNAFAATFPSAITLQAVPAYMQPTATDFITKVEYNTLGQVIVSTSPDEGTSRFAYRQDGQIRYSQSALQRPLNQVSYTNYDKYGRPIESGVLTGTATIWDEANANVDNTALIPNTTPSERTFTIYDYTSNTTDLSLVIPVLLSLQNQLPAYQQNNLAGNVAVTYKESLISAGTLDAISWYSYDIYGRSEWVVQYNAGLGIKTIHYQYDDKGNVSKVYYQKDALNELFVHRYTYDITNTLEKVETSTNNITFTTDAEYTYYATGELKRLNIAQGAQGLDYVYTLGGMLKSINHPSLEQSKDPGHDPNDVFGITLDYYDGDYTRANSNIITSPSITPDYNGNIKGTRWATKESQFMDLDQNGNINQKGYLYNYNRNNWLTDATFGNATAAGNINPITNRYQEKGLQYDANGNITKLQRTNDAGATIDNLDYDYASAGKNQLTQVTDATTTQYSNDIDSGQQPDNYVYDAIGQLILNKQEQIHYFYNTSGLVTEIKVGDLNPNDAYSKVKFFYNERGQRVKKESYGDTNPYSLQSTTYYLLDLSGNVMSVYNKPVNDIIKQVELPIYGSSRLGVCYKTLPNTETRSYQITDHLGNVRAVVKKDSSNPDLVVLLSYADYYPFGEQLPLRNSLDGSYRYAFQGQEKDPETGMEAFELRLWDGRLGRWLSPDPYGQYPSPYLGMGNNPINRIDPDGGVDGGIWDWLKNLFSSEPIDYTIELEEVEIEGKKSSHSNWFSSLFDFNPFHTEAAQNREWFFNFWGSEKTQNTVKGLKNVYEAQGYIPGVDAFQSFAHQEDYGKGTTQLAMNLIPFGKLARPAQKLIPSTVTKGMSRILSGKAQPILLKNGAIEVLVEGGGDVSKKWLGAIHYKIDDVAETSLNGTRILVKDFNGQTVYGYIKNHNYKDVYNIPTSSPLLWP